MDACSYNNYMLKRLVSFINHHGGNYEDSLPILTKNNILTNFLELITSSLDAEKFIQVVASANSQVCLVVDRKVDRSNLVMTNKCWGMHMYSYNTFRTPKVQCACMLDASLACECNYQIYHHYFCINPFHYNFNGKKECDGSFLKLKKSKMNTLQYLSLERFFSYRAPNYTLVPMNGDPKSTEFMLKSNNTSDILSSWICVSYCEEKHNLIYNKKYFGNSIKINCVQGKPTETDQLLNLDALYNPHRNDQVIECRNLIKDGIIIDRRQSMVFITLCTKIPVFIHSPFINYLEGKHFMHVTRIFDRTSIKIFDFDKFQETVDTKCNNQNYQEVLNLASFGSIEVSFVKGWGENYKRQRVNETPCWLHFRMIEALDYLDYKLKSMNGPNGMCPSTT